ncbi:MAG: hypothetical protein PHN63_03280 [Candidatus Omnitrophica bacterium]|nr:hypothetical protein [Candidatus Omnitrophota bacterium]
MKIKDIIFGCILGAISVFSPASFLVLGAFLLSLWLIKKYIRTESQKFLIAIFITGFILRVILSSFNYYAAESAGIGSDIQPDARVYNTNAFYIASVITGNKYDQAMDRDAILKKGMEVAGAIHRGKLPPVGTYQIGFYVYLIGWIYSLLGYCPIAMKIMNSVFGCGTAILTYLIARRISGSEIISKASAAVVMFFPSMVLWSAALLRDTIANFLFLAYMLSLLVYIGSGSRRSLVMSLMSTIVLSLFKEKAVLILAAGFVFVLIAGLFRRILNRKHLTVFVALFFIFTVTAGIFLSNKNFITRQLHDKTISMFTQHQSYAADDRAFVYRIFKDSIYEKGKLQLSDFSDASLYFSVFKALAYFFLSPFPWQVPYYHLGLLMFYPQVLATFISLPFIMLGLLMSMRRNMYVTAIIVMVLALIAVPYALAEGVVGIVVRHRDMFMPFLVIFASYGFFRPKAGVE